MRGMALIVIGIIVAVVGVAILVAVPSARVMGLILTFFGIAKLIYGIRKLSSGDIATPTPRTTTSISLFSSSSSERTVLQPQDSLPELPIKL